MSLVRRIYDGLSNVITGLGGQNDPRRGNVYGFTPLSPVQIEAAYRGSGMMRKVINIPAFDAVRAWRDWQAEADQIELIEAEEARLQIKQKIMQAEIMRGLGGGAIILGAPGDTAMPIGTSFAKGSLAFLHVVSRHRLTGQDWIDDASDPGFGGPAHWTLQAGKNPIRLHPSRVVCFRGEPVPDLNGQGAEDAFWGESRVQQVLDAVENADTAQQGFSLLIMKAKNTRVGISKLLDLISTEEGEGRIMQRLRLMSQGESTLNWTLYDLGEGEQQAEQITDHQVTWTGIPDVMDAFDQRVAAVSDIPMTRLVGRSPGGLNSTGQHDMANWNRMVGAKQELQLQPCLEQIDAVLIPSALGSRPPEIWFEFSPLDTPTEAEQATTFDKTMDAVTKLQNTGAIPDEAFAKGLQNLLAERAWVPGLDAALADIPEAERWGIQQEEDPDLTDPNAIVPPARRAANDARFNDATPRTLYVSRKLLNTAEFIKWAKGQGFDTTTPADDLHVTITFSRTPVDWMKMGATWEGGDKGEIVVQPGGARIVEALGDKGAAVLLFASSSLSWRHEEMARAGASFDFDEYQPHITITYAKPVGLDLKTVEPYRGALKFGPEIFEEVVDDWEMGIREA